MTKISLLIPLLFSSLTLTSLAQDKTFTPLFDGKTLNGWKTGKSTGEGDWGPFRINQEEKAIHVYKGEKAGSTQNIDYLYTEKEYSHFILRLEYKWLQNRFAPRVAHDRDAGLLFHVHGDLTKVWPLCLEMQIGETPADHFGKMRYHTGDLFVLGRDLRVNTPKTDNKYDPKGKWVNGRHCPTALGVEKPKGQWNKMEIIVQGSQKATFKLNGQIVHQIKDFTQKIDGKTQPLTKGRIGLQAEWAELLYRNIEIHQLPATEPAE